MNGGATLWVGCKCIFLIFLIFLFVLPLLPKLVESYPQNFEVPSFSVVGHISGRCHELCGRQVELSSGLSLRFEPTDFR